VQLGGRKHRHEQRHHDHPEVREGPDGEHDDDGDDRQPPGPGRDGPQLGGTGGPVTG
jgi:hypothetical protein